MKKVFIGILAATAVLVAVFYFVADSGPSYDTRPRRTFQAQDSSVAGMIQRARFSEDCTRLLTLLSSVAPGQSGKTVFLWDLEEEKQICKLNPELFGFQLAISPDNQHFALNGLSGVTPHVMIHESATGKLVRQLPLSPQSGAWDIEFSPDGETLIMLEGIPKVIATVWNWSENKKILSFDCRGFAMAISPDGRQIVTGGSISPQHNNNDDKARLWDIRTGRLLHELPGHKEGATQFAFSPDGAFVATGGGTAIVRTWDTTTGVLLRSLNAFPGEDRAVRSMAYSRDGTRLAVSYGFLPPQLPSNALSTWLYRLRIIISFGRSSLDFTSPVVLWDCSTWRPIHTYGLNEINAELAILPKDEGLVTIDVQGMVRWWDLR